MSIYNTVLKIGGSLLFNNDRQINSQKIFDLCNVLTDNEKSSTVAIIVGGGIIARNYIDFVRNATENEALCDLFGIETSRLNARLFISYLDNLAYPIVPTSYNELAIAQESNKIIVMGGLQPGQSTTSVALEVAEFLKAKRVVILTDVDGIYTKDPHKYEDAELIDSLNYSQLTKIILNTSSTQSAAGEYRIFDPVSLQILKRSKLKVFIGSGLSLDKFEKFWNRQIDNFGTFITE
ncbi:MAG: UMP kinase [Promethearchaeota archaeon]|nr:MAG: UMP kinase [Candidatus Lokiarchaeota archaeon]